MDSPGEGDPGGSFGADSASCPRVGAAAFAAVEGASLSSNLARDMRCRVVGVRRDTCPLALSIKHPLSKAEPSLAIYVVPASCAEE